MMTQSDLDSYPTQINIELQYSDLFTCWSFLNPKSQHKTAYRVFPPLKSTRRRRENSAIENKKLFFLLARLEVLFTFPT